MQWLLQLHAWERLSPRCIAQLAAHFRVEGDIQSCAAAAQSSGIAWLSAQDLLHQEIWLQQDLASRAACLVAALLASKSACCSHKLVLSKRSEDALLCRITRMTPVQAQPHCRNKSKRLPSTVEIWMTGQTACGCAAKRAFGPTCMGTQNTHNHSQRCRSTRETTHQATFHQTLR